MNSASVIQQFPEVWEFFRRIDEIWRRDLEGLAVSINEDQMLPLVLYASAHANMRISMELGFSAC
jgi:hypothetical protein